ncbi:hypothetical protein TanjilG_15688 [Lupinus angustifolius]|uniref:Protein kinase domain-containing protein n=1 Tax=Lupinus angustifolius TaxID=3871 RepID=A0A1J7GWJ6_LUPAN|nr:hypothetical protein TanjilG_15688 [Lupinus angustifolius]
MIKMLLHYLLVLLRVLTMVVLIQAQDQSGFISIDCGLPENANYTDDTTGIYYTSDDKFISSGESVSLSYSQRKTYERQLWYVRSFPKGERNCYRINVTSGTKYLIRADFIYGNYDGLSKSPIFDLYIGANPWEVPLSTTLISRTEIIHSPPLDFIHICLVNTDQGTPFISSIELRALENDIYDTESGSLALYRRYDLGSTSDSIYRVLGRGGFGPVYHGFLDGIEVAVKMLSQSSVRGYQQFLAEVKLLMIVHHRNLTSLVGYCNEEGNIGLIYEYMANGNLDEHLSGLEYLHNGCKPPIIHRDVKCTNILLNENLQAKVADFGLSKSFSTDGETHLSTVVAGTHGYMDPDYTMSNRLTEKSDVYGFGVVILEIITGQPAIIKMHDDYKIHISQWVSPMISNGDIENIVDSKLEGDFDTNSVWKAVEIAMACLSKSSKRPNMSKVVTELKECFTAELARKRTDRDTENQYSTELVPLNLTIDFGPSAR